MIEFDVRVNDKEPVKMTMEVVAKLLLEGYVGAMLVSRFEVLGKEVQSMINLLSIGRGSIPYERDGKVILPTRFEAIEGKVDAVILPDDILNFIVVDENHMQVTIGGK